MRSRLSAMAVVGLSGLLLAGPAMSAAAMESSNLEIEACFPELTPLGRFAVFQQTAVFAIDTDAKGAVQKLTQLLPAAPSPFVALEGVETCIRGWRGESTGHYTVYLEYGTTGETLKRWVLSVADGSGERVRMLKSDRIRIVVPRTAIPRGGRGPGPDERAQ